MQNILIDILLVKTDITVHYILVRELILQKHEIIKNLSENICRNEPGCIQILDYNQNIRSNCPYCIVDDCTCLI